MVYAYIVHFKNKKEKISSGVTVKAVSLTATEFKKKLFARRGGGLGVRSKTENHGCVWIRALEGGIF